MNLERVTSGRDVPNDVNVIIEIPMNADPVKYEVDKETGAVFVDRFMSTAMHYPCDYGYVPRTLSGDGHYKDLERGKWVKVRGWVGAAAAKSEILEGMARFKKAKRP